MIFKLKKIFILFLIFILLFFLVFKNLIINLDKNLLSWGDYPFIIWQMNQILIKIRNLNFLNFFDSNAFYSNKLSFLFSDTLITQGLLSLVISFFTKNYILIFNIIFFITFLLNYISSFLFWQQIFKKNIISFFGALFIVFSPFFHLQLGHFQMLSFWPFFFCLYFLVKNEDEKNKYLINLILAGIFLSIQFLSSVYLSFFLIFSIFLFYLINFFYLKNKERNIVIKNLFIIFFVFTLLCGIFVKGYLNVKKMYHIKRDIREYITYSAHLSDYFFTTTINSIIHKNIIINRWNSFDKHIIGEKTAFTGFLFLFLAVLGLFNIKKQNESLSIEFKITKERLFFFSLIIFGFIFSLGPRVSFNGNYSHIPNIYYLALKYIPFFEVIRAPARWSFLFYFGVIYFALDGFKKHFVNNKFLILTIFFLFIFEYLPLTLKTSSNYDYLYYKSIMKNYCRDKKVLFFYPTTHLNVKGGIMEGLNYITSILLSSLDGDCYLFNGYSGYDLPSIKEIELNFEKFINKREFKNISSLICGKGINTVMLVKNKIVDRNIDIKNIDKFIEYNTLSQNRCFDIVYLK